MRKKSIVLIVLMACFLLTSCSKPTTNKEITELSNLEKRKQLEEKTQEIQDIVNKTIPGIVCWGDSLTEGVGGDTSYPEYLQILLKENLQSKYDLHNYFDSSYDELINNYDFTLKDIDIVNMGVGGETSSTIVSRNGAIPMVVAYDIVIPSDTIPVQLSLDFYDGGPSYPLRNGDGGVNPVTINNIKGELTVVQDNPFSDYCEYYFTRLEQGEETYVQIGTPVHTDIEDKYLDYLMIIYMGTNGGYLDAESLIHQHQTMIDKQINKKYLIIGMHYGDTNELDIIDSKMKETFNDNYIQVNHNVSKDMLNSDGLHFNNKGYQMIANMVYERLDKLGYLD